MKNEEMTLLIPGYGGNRISFGGIARRWRADHLGTFDAVVRIHADGTYTVKKVDGRGKNNYIQVLFDDNRAPAREVAELHPFVAHLAHQGIRRINFVGHSTGGPTSVAFMAAYSQDAAMPKFAKLVNLGGDFPKKISPAELAQGKRLPPDLKVLNIAGRLWNMKTDGLVPLAQVKGLEKIIDPHKFDYRLVEITGSPLKAFHFMLHENRQIDHLIARFLWDKKSTPAGALGKQIF